MPTSTITVRDSSSAVQRSRTRPRAPDVTLINLNLLLARGARFFDKENYIPLGLLYIAAYLERAGLNVEFVDYQLFDRCDAFDPVAFVTRLGDTAPLVGLSCMSNLLPFTLLVAEAIKQRRPGTTLALGGVGPSPVRDQIVKAFPFIDVVVEGEGELCMGDIANGDRTPVPPRRSIDDIDALPLPAYSHIRFDAYIPARSIITSRGCPQRCSFCTEAHNFGANVRFRSVDSVVGEIELLHSLHPHTTFLFQDDMLPLNRGRFTKLLAALRGLSFPIRWKCFARVDLMDVALMSEMAASGCVQVRYGVEAGSDETLRRIGKPFTIEQAYEVARESTRHFPSVHASFIWGFPFEDAQAFEMTQRWVERFESIGVSVLLFEFSPLPGSALYREFPSGLAFSPERYSAFVATGQEVLGADGTFRATASAARIYALICRHPQIFPGFYHYTHTETLRGRLRLLNPQATSRTKRRNEYDT